MTEITKNTNTNTMETKRLKMVRGSKERADEIKAWLESQNGKNVRNFDFSSDNFLYYIDGFGEINFLDIDDVKGLKPFIDCEIIELPEKKQPEYQFKPFEKVLCRFEGETWYADLFACKEEAGTYHYVCVGGYWEECIPYEGNEHLLGTTDNPKEGGDR